MVSIYWRSVTAHLARACESMGNITQWIIFSLFSEALSIAQWAISFCIGNPVTLAAAAAVTSEKFIVMHSLTAVPSDHVLLLLPINNHLSHCAHRSCLFSRCALDVRPTVQQFPIRLLSNFANCWYDAILFPGRRQMSTSWVNSCHGPPPNHPGANFCTFSWSRLSHRKTKHFTL